MKPSDPLLRLLMRVYGWLFLATGVVFVMLPGPLLGALNAAAAWLPGSAPLPGAVPSLWLGLSGSMMAMIAALSFALARYPGRSLAWDVLLLSKGMSTVLFTAFALFERNSLFLVGSVVDGAIFAHLFYLMRSAEEDGAGDRDLWQARSDGAEGYETWFLKLNGPASGSALWLRYELVNSDASCWYVFFDGKERKVLSGRMEGSSAAEAPGLVCRIGKSELGRGAARGSGPGISWDLSWTDGGSPPFSFVPACLFRWGAAGTQYGVPLSYGRFRGEFKIGGKLYKFTDAPGSAGHLWGRRMGDNWRWAHAVLPGDKGDTVFEILSAQGRAGPVLTPRFTLAHLWHGGRHYASTGIVRGLCNATSGEDGRWSFRVDFGELRAEGECSSPADMTAELEYTDTDGRKLTCRNSKTGALRLALARPDGTPVAELRTEDSAAVETVRGKA